MRWRHTRIALIVTLSVMFMALDTACAQNGSDSSVADLVKAINGFSFDLWKTTASGNDGDMILSPFSVHSALSMTLAGARGVTAEEMARTLRTSTDPDSVCSQWAGLMARTRREGIVDSICTLSIAEALWSDSSYPILPAYEALVSSTFDAQVCGASFGSDAGRKEAAEAISRWVSDETRGKIKAFLKSSDIDWETVLILVNAVYFEGQWRVPFSPLATTLADFHRADGSMISVPMMRRTVSGRVLRLFETPEFQLLELPYKDDRFAMLIALPREVKGLGSVEAKLSADQVSDWIGQVSAPPEGIEVHIPRFRVDTHIELRGPLRGLGMIVPFSMGLANFSGMFGTGEAFISRVIHGAHVAVDEHGTVAAAATAVEMTLGKPREPVVFNADHPFLFLIYERQLGLVLFIGRYAGVEG